MALNPFMVNMDRADVPDPVPGGVYVDEYGHWWQYKGLSAFGEFYFVSLRTHMQHHTWISKETWKQDPMTGYTPQELSPRGRPRPPIIRKTTPER